MIVYPNAKINLGLNICAKRLDGYHNIETLFYPIAWQDALEIIISDEYQFTSTGLEIDADEQDNLCTKAYKIIANNYKIPPVHIHLHKVIPMGAGLGGGSSDATFTLKALNQLFDLNISNKQLEIFATELGADCPFFVENKPVKATQKGEVFTPIDLDLSSFHIVVIYPEIHVSTKDAFAGVKPMNQSIDSDNFSNLDFVFWKDHLKNDFETTIFNLKPELAKIKESLYLKGAKYASMSGSGSAIYGIFDTQIPLNDFNEYVVWQGKLTNNI